LSLVNRRTIVFMLTALMLLAFAAVTVATFSPGNAAAQTYNCNAGIGNEGEFVTDECPLGDPGQSGTHNKAGEPSD